MLQTVTDELGAVGHAVATVVSAPFRLIARLFGGG
ncbi:LPFR motif small protein [Streptomyces sp. NPDC001667]